MRRRHVSKEKPPDEPRGKLLKIDLPFEEALKAAMEVRPKKAKRRPRAEERGHPPKRVPPP